MAQIWSDGCQATAQTQCDELGPAADWPILICLLGDFRLVKLGQRVLLRQTSKTEGLLSALALRGEVGVPRETLEATLWPESEGALAHQSLNSLVYSVQKLLSDGIAGAAPILSQDGNYRLNGPAGVGVDIAVFESLVREANARARSGETALAAQREHEAIALYRGDLRSGADLYAAVERERLRARYQTLLAHLAEYYFAAADYALSLEHAQRILAQEPCREDAHRMCMRSYMRLGERAQALRQYRLCERILRAEFEAAPEQETLALFDRIRLAPHSV